MKEDNSALKNIVLPYDNNMVARSRNAPTNELGHNTSSIIAKINDERDRDVPLLTQSVRISTNPKNIASCNKRMGDMTLFSGHKSGNTGDNGPLPSTYAN